MSFHEFKKTIESASAVWIYGAHAIGEDLFLYMKMHGLEQKVRGFVVSSLAGNPTVLHGHPVKALNDVEDEMRLSWILVATPEKFFAEIRESLQTVGADHVVFIGNKGMSALENADVVSFLKKHYPEFQAELDENEYICVKLCVAGEQRKLIPLGAFPFDEECIQVLDSMKDLKEMHVSSRDGAHDPKTGGSDLKVYVVSSPKDITFPSGRAMAYWEEPLIAGAVFLEQTEQTEMYGDNRNDNISLKNRIYAETTGTYWVWKNSDAQYKGISHYRRRYLLTEEDTAEILSDRYDAVVTTPRLVLPSVGKWFTKVSSLKTEHQKLLVQAVAEYCPDYRDLFVDFLDGNLLYPNNMIIASKDIYDEYCSFLFSVLQILEEESAFDAMRSQPRYIGYCAELLTSFYLSMRKTEGLRLRSVEYELLG